MEYTAFVTNTAFEDALLPIGIALFAVGFICWVVSLANQEENRIAHEDNESIAMLGTDRNTSRPVHSVALTGWVLVILGVAGFATHVHSTQVERDANIAIMEQNITTKYSPDDVTVTQYFDDYVRQTVNSAMVTQGENVMDVPVMFNEHAEPFLKVNTLSEKEFAQKLTPQPEQ
jgi:hypothetical protein